MVTIKPSTELKNNYNELSRICHENNEPVFITKDGHSDSVLLSIERYNQLAGMQELYRLIDEGIEDEINGDTMPFEEAMEELHKRIVQRTPL
jgi:PHD/YefM family antitoxin component YafN of YafNO toxin-antitoxin module